MGVVDHFRMSHKETVDFASFLGLLLASMDVVSPTGERINPTVNPKHNLLMFDSCQTRAAGLCPLLG
jgi:predicted small integral membrane protein